MIFRASWLTLGIFSAALANFAKKIQELAEDKAENPRTCRGQSREQSPYERLPENSNLKALFLLTTFLIATLQTPKTLGGGTPPRGRPPRSCLGFRFSWRGLQPTLLRKSKKLPRTKPRIQELAEDKAENKIHTNAYQKTQISKLCSSKVFSFSQTSLLRKHWAAVLPPGGLQSAAHLGTAC